MQLADGGGSSKLNTLLPPTRRDEYLRSLDWSYKYVKVRCVTTSRQLRVVSPANGIRP